MDPQETMDPTENQVALARKVPQAVPDQLVPQDPQEPMAPMVPLVIRVKMDPKKLKFQENKDQLVKMAAPDQRDPLETPDPTELLEPPEAKDPQVPQAQTVNQVMPVKMVKPEQLAQLVIKVFARNIVLWMVVFSSKMVPKVKI
jgi:hypothetical protein